MTEAPVVRTIGHGTLPAAAFVDLVHGTQTAHIVDIRSYPGSRRNPHYGRPELERWLPAAGVGYSWEPRLGGRRRPDPLSRHLALRHHAFRAYADHMGTPEFQTALDELVRIRAGADVAVMCSESVWWRCHRRLLSDALVLLRSVPVLHLFHDGRLAEHRPTPEARVVDGGLVYDLGTSTSML